MAINRLAIATGGYEPGATYSRELLATYGYWNYAISSGSTQDVPLNFVALKPNVIYYDDDALEIFIDALHRIGTSSSCEIVEYYSSQDGLLKQLTKAIAPRGLTLSGKVDEYFVPQVRRQLNYLRGKQVYICLGASNIATLARIRHFSMPIEPSTYMPITLDIVCDSEIEGQFYEAEASPVRVSGDVDTEDSIMASGGYYRSLEAQNATVYFRIEQSDWELPEGDYTMFVRAWGMLSVSDDLHLEVYNDTDSTSLASNTHTATPNIFKWYTLDFTVASDDVGDTIKFLAKKATATTNNVDIDFMGFVKK